MEKKIGNAKLKKFIAILCIFVILQSYFSYFAQIVIATDETIIGGSQEETPTDDEVTIGGENSGEIEGETGEKQNNQNDNDDEVTIGDETEAPQEDNEIVENDSTEPEDNNGDDETVIGGESGTENEVSNPEDNDSTNVENSVDNSEESNTDNTTDDTTSNETEAPDEEEPYVEPEATIEVTSENPSIYKGYLYANATSDLYYETNYNTIDTLTLVR